MNTKAVSNIVSSSILIAIALVVCGILYFSTIENVNLYASVLVPNTINAEIFGSLAPPDKIILSHYGGSPIDDYIIKINNESIVGTDFKIGGKILLEVNLSHPNQVFLISDNQVLFEYNFPSNPQEPTPPSPPEPLEVVLRISDVSIEHNYLLINASTSLEALQNEDNKSATHQDSSDTCYWRFGFNDTTVTNITNVTMCIFAEQVFDAGQITSYISFGWNPIEVYVGFYGCYEVVYEVNPTTGLNWTTAELNNLQGQVASGRDNKNCIINCANIRVTYL